MAPVTSKLLACHHKALPSHRQGLLAGTVTVTHLVQTDATGVYWQHCCWGVVLDLAWLLLMLRDRYTLPEGGKALPLCATQYFPHPSPEGQKFNRVTQTEADPISKANAADLAHAWSTGGAAYRHD